MPIDHYDSKIIELIFKNNQCSSTQLAKLIFKCKNRYDIINNNSFINYRLKKLTKSEILLFSNGIYTLNKDKILQGNSKMIIGDKELDFGNTIVIFLNDDDYIIHFLDE